MLLYFNYEYNQFLMMEDQDLKCYQIKSIFI